MSEDTKGVIKSVQSCDYRIIFQALGQVEELMFGKFKPNKIIIDNT
jgi:hypothetical protein